MAAAFTWVEDNGTVGAKTTTNGRTGCFWQNIDTPNDSLYSANPIQAGNNSFAKYQWVAFSGTYNLIQNCILTHSSGILTNVALKCLISSVYVQPSTTAITGVTLTDITTVGQTTGTVSFTTGGSGPTGSPVATLTSSAAGSTQYLVTQLQTTPSAASGDIGSVILTLSYDES
jgi:hypothetical protein